MSQIMSESPDEVVVAVDGSIATTPEAISAAQAGVKEQIHLKEWAVARPGRYCPGPHDPDVRI